MSKDAKPEQNDPSLWQRIAEAVGRVRGREEAQPPTHAQPEKGTPDPGDVDRLTAAMKKEWSVGEKPTASSRTLDLSQNWPPKGDEAKGPGVWDHFANGVRGGLSDFVERTIIGQVSPEHAHDKGHDR